MKKRVIFLDGKMMEADARLAESLTPGILCGRGVFETMRVCDGVICDLKDHLARLSRGMYALGIKSPYSQARLQKYLFSTVKANGLRQARIRIALWKENKRRRIAVVCEPFDGYPPKKYANGFKVMVSEIKRKKGRFSHVKSLDYGCFRRAFLGAKKAGYDEAVLLNNRNKIVEGSRTNVFFVRNGVVYTPAVREGCLNGITRRQVIRCAHDEGVRVARISAEVRQLFGADEAFVTNSLMGIMPVTSVNGRKIGTGDAGPVTTKLINAYRPNSALEI